MLRILLIGCLFVLTGFVEASSSDLQKLVNFFNGVFYFGPKSTGTPHLYFEGELNDVPGGLSGTVQIGLMGSLKPINNQKISYPDSNTKVCTMELQVTDAISVDGIKNKFGLKLSQCHILFQFSVSNKTGVTIKPETVLLFGCNVKQGDGSPSPWGPQVTSGLSKLLMAKAEQYLTHHYTSADTFSIDEFKKDTPTTAEFVEILKKILQIV